MKKHGVKVKQRLLKRRHIEDVPFYKFTYGIDDLPLDPAIPFVLEKISNYFN